MQRLGFLKFVLQMAKQHSTFDQQSMGTWLREVLAAPVAAALTNEVAGYMERILGESQSKSEEPVPADGHGSVTLQLQDIYLANSKLTSKRGRLGISDDFLRYPQFAANLGLTRRDSGTILVRGNVLLALTTPEELAAFRRLDLDHNPCDLSLAQRLFFLYVLLDADWAVLQPLYSKLCRMERAFSDMDAGDLLPDILRQLSRDARARVTNAAEGLELAKLADTADAIEKRKGHHFGKTVREQTITPRLEPFADIGILGKVVPYSYEYQMTANGRALMAHLTSGEGLQGNLQTSLFTSWQAHFGPACSRLLGEEALPVLYQSWKSLTSPLGYAPIEEVVLLAAITAVADKGTYFEMADGRQVLEDARRKDPNLIRYNVDRMGRPVFMKFLKPFP